MLAIRRLLMSPVAACVCKWSLIFHTLLSFPIKLLIFYSLHTSYSFTIHQNFFFLSCNLMLHQKIYFLSSLYNLFDFYHALVCAKIRKSCFSNRDFLFYPLDLIHNTPREKRIAAKKNRRKFSSFFFFFSTLVIMNTITESYLLQPSSTVTERMTRDEKILLQESCFMLQSMKAPLLWRH